MRAFLGLMRAPLGYNPANVMRLGIIRHGTDHDEQGRMLSREWRTAYFEQIREKIASVPGVSAVAVAADATPPYAGAENAFEIDGTRDQEQPTARVMLVDQRYFAALRISLLQGRIWSKDENTRGDFIAIVNQAFSTRYLSSSNAPDSSTVRQLRVPGLTA